jgi:hypothetical protein
MRTLLRSSYLGGTLVAVALATACGGGDDSSGGDGETPEPEAASWQLVHEALPSALLSVWGSSTKDVWAVGGDTGDGKGPLVVHFDGESWERVKTGQSEGTLWWVFGFAGGPVFMGGAGGMILRYEEGEFTLMDTPSNDTVFGIWGASENDVWAVGGASESGGGFAWRLRGGTWAPEPTLPKSVPDSAAIWKIFGTKKNEAWLVGSNGVSLHWDGTSLEPGDTGVGSSLFTVYAGDGRYAAVGGLASGIIVEYQNGKWKDVTPDPLPQPLSGVTLDDKGGGFAVGALGYVYSRDEDGWHEVDTGFFLDENLHGTWLDAKGGLWAVGGQTYSEPYTAGVMLHRGKDVPTGGL